MTVFPFFNQICKIAARNTELLATYSIAGGTAFAVDLLCFYLLTHYTGLHYLGVTILAFAVGTTLHFVLTRFLVFTKTTRRVKESYPIFVSVTSLGLVLTTLGMYVAVGILDLEKVFSRILVAGLVGVLSFALHKKVSFKHPLPENHAF